MRPCSRHTGWSVPDRSALVAVRWDVSGPVWRIATASGGWRPQSPEVSRLWKPGGGIGLILSVNGGRKCPRDATTSRCWPIAAATDRRRVAPRAPLVAGVTDRP